MKNDILCLCTADGGGVGQWVTSQAPNVKMQFVFAVFFSFHQTQPVYMHQTHRNTHWYLYVSHIQN